MKQANGDKDFAINIGYTSIAMFLTLSISERTPNHVLFAGYIMLMAIELISSIGVIKLI